MKPKTPSQLTLAAFNATPPGVRHVCPPLKPLKSKPASGVPNRLMRRPEVQQVTGLSRTALYRLIGASDFPQQVRLSTHTVGWLCSEVEAWIAGRVAASRKRADRSTATGRS